MILIKLIFTTIHDALLLPGNISYLTSPVLLAVRSYFPEPHLNRYLQLYKGKFQFTPSGVIPPGGFTIAIPFSVDKNTTSYAETLSYHNLFLNINNFCYSIRL